MLKIEQRIHNLIQFSVNISTGNVWRMAHTANKVITIVEGGKRSETTSRYPIEEADTFEELLSKAAALKLDIEFTDAQRILLDR